jgi:DNA-binding protein Alba
MHYLLVSWQEKGAPEIVLKAMGRAINKTVTIAEIIKVIEVLIICHVVTPVMEMQSWLIFIFL